MSQNLFQKVQERVNNGHRHMTYQTGNNDGHNHSVQAVQAVTDPQESLLILCELVEEELSNMKGHITQLTKYLLDQDGLVDKKVIFKELVNDETKNLLIEARDEIIKLRSQADFLSEDDMKLK